jgi:hypothetical protein
MCTRKVRVRDTLKPVISLNYAGNTFHTSDGSDTTLSQSVKVTNPMPQKITGHGRYYKTFDKEHELGEAPWIAGVPRMDSADQCKQYCASIPACKYGTFVSGDSGGQARAGECWLAAQTLLLGAKQKRCGVACESFFEAGLAVPEITRVTTTQYAHRRLLTVSVGKGAEITQVLMVLATGAVLVALVFLVLIVSRRKRETAEPAADV